MSNDMKSALTDTCREGRKTKKNGPYRNQKYTDPLKLDNFNRRNNYYETRCSSLKYSVIRQFLKSKVGQNWNDVYSEYCSKFDSRTGIGRKARVSLTYYVEIKCIVDKNGEILSSNGEKTYCDFYVDSNTNLLQEMKKERHKYKKPVKKIVFIDGINYYKYEGIWYRVIYKKIDPNERIMFSANILQDVFGNYNFQELFKSYGMRVVILKKQQASKKECKKLRILFPNF